MRRMFLFLLALTACGGGPVEPNFGAVVQVRYGDPEPGASGSTYFEDPIRIVIDPAYSGPFLTATLRHELWHAMTGLVDHSPDEDCISHSPAPDGLAAPCFTELLQVRAARMTPMAFAFPDEPEELEAAISWWNYHCGKIVAVLAEP